MNKTIQLALTEKTKEWREQEEDKEVKEWRKDAVVVWGKAVQIPKSNNSSIHIRQISVLCIDNKDSVFCILYSWPCLWKSDGFQAEIFQYRSFGTNKASKI